MSRQERAARERYLRKRATAWPAELVELPESEWPAAREGVARPLAIWRSRHYLAMRYPAPSFQGVEVRRLTVNRATLRRDGHWEEQIPWDDLQRCKRETGHGHWYAIEVYPRDRDLVIVANMRHLWLIAEPLPIGWFAFGISSDASPSVAFAAALGLGEEPGE
jgi:hypothetical protein